jgi:drug/metabolite transporter (DMT)-like permease
MTAAHTLRTKTYVLIALMVCFGPTGDVLLGKGMKEVGALTGWSPAQLAHFLLHAISNPTVWLGICSLLLFFLSYMLVLSWADFSYVLPASAAGYAVVPLLGHLFLAEFVSPLRWTGVAFICLGVALVGNTPPNTTAPARISAHAAQAARPVEGD